MNLVNLLCVCVGGQGGQCFLLLFVFSCSCFFLLVLRHSSVFCSSDLRSISTGRCSGERSKETCSRSSCSSCSSSEIRTPMCAWIARIRVACAGAVNARMHMHHQLQLVLHSSSGLQLDEILIQHMYIQSRLLMHNSKGKFTSGRVQHLQLESSLKH